MVSFLQTTIDNVPGMDVPGPWGQHSLSSPSIENPQTHEVANNSTLDTIDINILDNVAPSTSGAIAGEGSHRRRKQRDPQRFTHRPPPRGRQRLNASASTDEEEREHVAEEEGTADAIAAGQVDGGAVRLKDCLNSNWPGLPEEIANIIRKAETQALSGFEAELVLRDFEKCGLPVSIAQPHRAPGECGPFLPR
jgi:hypothetical protein